MGQCKSENAEMDRAHAAQVQKRVSEYNIQKAKIVEAHKNSAVVQTEQQVDQNVEVYSPKSESKDARDIQKKLTVFFLTVCKKLSQIHQAQALNCLINNKINKLRALIGKQAKTRSNIILGFKFFHLLLIKTAAYYNLHLFYMNMPKLAVF